jgi:hypothetical protein
VSEGPGPGTFRSRLAATALSGALLAALATVVAGFIVRQSGLPGAAAWLSRFLVLGGWFAIVLWGLAGGGFASLAYARGPRQVAVALTLGIVAAALGVMIAIGSRGELPAGPGAPASAGAKARSILRWSFRSPETVERILPFALDPSPQVREQAVLALGVNLIVRDIEKADARFPARYADLPLRGRIRDALIAALGDSVESVRAEAARALWKAPRTFGARPAAAETLAAVLDRATRPGAVERMAWLALDAAAGAPHPALKAAAARFAATVADSALARAARTAAAP